MTVTIIKPSTKTPPKRKGRPLGSHKHKSIKPLIPGSLIRLETVLQHLPISASSWRNGQLSGKYPLGELLSERTRVYRADDIIALLENVGG